MTNNSIEKDTLTKFVDGELDLATSFWGFLMVGSAIVGFVSGWLMGVYGNGWAIPMVLYTLAAVVGTWRAAEKWKIEQMQTKDGITQKDIDEVRVEAKKSIEPE